MTRTSMLKFGRATKPRRNLMCNKKLDEAVKVTKKPPESGTLKRSNDNLPKYEQLPSKKRNEIKRIDKSEEENTNDVEKNYSPVERVPIPAKPETIRCRRSTRERKPLQKFTFIPEVKIRRPRKDPASENVDECTACGKKGLLLCCEACPKAFHLKCITPSLKELPSGTWFCDECHNKEHDDVCDICGWGGELLCCDKCSLAYHLKCVNMEGLPEDEWICPKCLKPPYTPHDGPDDIAILKENFMQYGLCRLKRALTTRQTQSCLDLTLERLHEAFDTVRRLGLEQELVDVGFTTFKTRSRDRYDLRIPEFMKKEFSYMNTKAPWLPLVKAILGSKIKVVHTGVMISLPGSETQPYHMDGPHLNEKKHLPVVPHILNVFVPLVDLTPEVGPTEFVPTSHIQGNYWDPGTKPMTINAGVGQCILFDYRIKHRGLGNKSGTKRPVIYITYAKKDFKDVKNFSKKRYKKLPKLE